MNISAFNKDKYENFWLGLDAELRSIETHQGLTTALETLRAQQRDQGFIRDDLESVERFYFLHPEKPELYFSVQYNPVRLLRFQGAGRSVPPPGLEPVNYGCFLCRENIRWQQCGIEMGYEVTVGDSAFYALMNAYPLMPVHLVFASKEHLPQSWNQNHGLTVPSRVEKIIHDLVHLSTRLPGYFGFYNGKGAGASIPGHFHYQFLKRPQPEMYLPLEIAAKQPRTNGSQAVSDYPIPAMHWCDTPEMVISGGAAWLSDWIEENGEFTSRLSANIIAVARDSTQADLYIVPRDRAKSNSPEMVGIIGGLEILGELVFSSEEEKARLDHNEVNYQSVERILTSVRPDFRNGA